MKIYEKNKFKPWQRERSIWLKNLSMKKAVRITELLLASALNWEWRKNYFPDNPVCLKKIINKKA